MKIHSMGAALFHADKETDRRSTVMVKLQSFHNFAEVPKNVSLGSGMGRHEPD